MWETCFAGLHTEHCWRCSIGSNKCQQLLEMTLLGQAGSLVSCLPNLGHFCIVGWSHQKGKWRQTHINSALSCLVRRESQSKQGQNVWNTFCLLSYFAKLDFSYERERERERERSRSRPTHHNKHEFGPKYVPFWRPVLNQPANLT
jgi:hypothetical protein